MAIVFQQGGISVLARCACFHFNPADSTSPAKKFSKQFGNFAA
jgi:hypothetical protein